MLIGLIGHAGSGKTTAARYMQKYYGFVPLKMADPLKAALYALGASASELEGEGKELPSPLFCNRTPRHAMQTLGTEWGRQQIGESFWIKVWKRKFLQLDSRTPVVCDDVRFVNEADMIKNSGGFLIRLERGTPPSSIHISEIELKSISVTEIWDNSGDINLLRSTIDSFLTDRVEPIRLRP
jgi:hypothetical protein